MVILATSVSIAGIVEAFLAQDAGRESRSIREEEERNLIDAEPRVSLPTP